MSTIVILAPFTFSSTLFLLILIINVYIRNSNIWRVFLYFIYGVFLCFLILSILSRYILFLVFGIFVHIAALIPARYADLLTCYYTYIDLNIFNVIYVLLVRLSRM